MDEQDTPIEAGHDDASKADKLAGLVEQMRQDAAAGSITDVDDALRQRIDDAGINLDDEEFATVLAAIRS
jgi:flagellar motility protein MotE (MotC chaperone)